MEDTNNIEEQGGDVGGDTILQPRPFPEGSLPDSGLVSSQYNSSEIMEAREQRSHISIIQMAPPAPGHSKGSSSSSSQARTTAVEVAKTPNASKKSKAGGGSVTRGEGAPSKKKRHHCSVQGCTYNTSHTKDLARHMRKHTGEKPFRCHRCSKSFTRSDKLVMHIRIHEGHRPFSCQFCGHSAIDSGSLKKHLRTHSNERPYKCHLCSYSSKDSSQLIVHLRHHTGDCPYVCVFEGCDAAFKTNSDLSRHLRLHTGEKPFKCLYCSYRAAVKSNLNVHMRRHTNPKAKKKKGVTANADEDEETRRDIPATSVPSPPSSSNLNNRLPFQYACKLCDHKADTIELFLIHMERFHPDSSSNTSNGRKGRTSKKVKDFAEDQRKYQCSSCSAAFKCENSLRCHMRQHGTVPNKPANVNPQLYSPTPTPSLPTPAHVNIPNPIIAEDVVNNRTIEYDVVAPPPQPPSRVSYINDAENSERGNGYTLHEMQRMPVVQSVITENPSAMHNSMIGSGNQIIQQHYDPETGHLYVVTYTCPDDPNVQTLPPNEYQTHDRTN